MIVYSTHLPVWGVELLPLSCTSGAVVGSEKEEEYVEVARQRITAHLSGTLKVRPLGLPVHQPSGREKVSQEPAQWQ